jgi:hypothetical protein
MKCLYVPLVGVSLALVTVSAVVMATVFCIDGPGLALVTVLLLAASIWIATTIMDMAIEDLRSRRVVPVPARSLALTKVGGGYKGRSVTRG